MDMNHFFVVFMYVYEWIFVDDFVLHFSVSARIRGKLVTNLVLVCSLLDPNIV